MSETCWKQQKTKEAVEDDPSVPFPVAINSPLSDTRLKAYSVGYF